MEDEKDRAEKVRNGWAYRAVLACSGPQSVMGAVIIAMIGKQRRTVPQFGRSAIIDPIGMLRADLYRKDGTWAYMTGIMSVDSFRDELGKVADHIDATDDERADMYKTAREWIGRDLRIIKNPLKFAGEK